MKQQAKATRPVLPAINIDDVLNGDICPYCGIQDKGILQHIRTCNHAKCDIETARTIDSSHHWAIHETCGKVMVLARRDGLCLIENGEGRYVVPLPSLKFGTLSRLLDQIESADLAQDEVEILINILRVQSREFGSKFPSHPQLWPGCRVEIQLGDQIKPALIKAIRGNGYLAQIEGGDKTVNISPKHIVRLL